MSSQFNRHVYTVPLAPPDGVPIPDHPGYYATSDGHVWTTMHGRGHRREPLMLAEHTDQHGYRRVRISGRRCLVHRLVLSAFSGPAPAGMECRHLDGTRDNNAIANLKWGTRKENAADRLRHGTQMVGAKAHGCRWPEDVVQAVVNEYEAGGVTQRELAERIGASLRIVRCWIAAKDLPSRMPPIGHSTVTHNRPAVGK